MTPGPVQPLLQGLYFQALWFGDRVVHLITILFPLHRIQDENDIDMYSQRICRLKTVFFSALDWSSSLVCRLGLYSLYEKLQIPSAAVFSFQSKKFIEIYLFDLRVLYQCKIVMN